MDTTTESPMRAARLAKGWSLRKLVGVLAAEAGVAASDGNLSRIENGEVAPGPALRKALADLLGIRPDQMKPDQPKRRTT